eukprot:scaffold10472_cov93-Cyclotella_meneghiniana.AAC.2
MENPNLRWGDVAIDYEVVECDISKRERVDEVEEISDVESDEEADDGLRRVVTTIEHKYHSIKYSGKVRIMKIQVDFSVLVREHAEKVHREINSMHQLVLKERPLTHAEKEYKEFVAAVLKAHLSLGFVLTGQLGHFSKLQMGIDESDMEVLRKRIEKQETQYAKLLMEQSKYNLTSDSAGKLQIPESVHIILFLPDTPQQHVHTIEFPKGSGSNILLAFEDEYECHPEETAFEPLAQYCESAGIPVAIVPMGFELTPPQMNSNDNDEEDVVINPSQDNSSTADVSFKNISSPSSSDDLNAWQ